jgi:hypothetical protein
VQVEGVSPEEHRRLARELAERQRQCTTMELELRAALDKLEVYRCADDAAAGAPAATATTSAGALTVAGMSQQPDEEKSVEELRAELEQLRQAMALQGEEAQKVSPPRNCQHLALAAIFSARFTWLAQRCCSVATENKVPLSKS